MPKAKSQSAYGHARRRSIVWVAKGSQSQSDKLPSIPIVSAMSKISDCDSLERLCRHCQYFLHSPYLICAVNPHGPEGPTCEDFEAIAQSDSKTVRQPLLGGYYAGDWIPQPFPTLTTAEQLALLDWHPQFTNRCPNYEIQ